MRILKFWPALTWIIYPFLAYAEDYRGITTSTPSIILYTAAISLMGFSVFILVSTIFSDEDKYKAEESLEDIDKQKIASQGFILRVSRPFFRRYLVPVVSNMKGKRRINDKYRRKLASAGLSDILNPFDFYAYKLFLIIGFPISFLIIRELAGTGWPLSYIPFVAIAGFYYPDIWINGKISKRKAEIIQCMPFAVDMLALSVEAGLDFVAAMNKVVEKAKHSALLEEFQMVMKEIKVGAARAEALRAMAWRTDLIQVSSFCATLIAADSVGASIGPILKALSAEIRQKKSADIEKAAAKAATKLLFPIMAFIVPAVFLVVATPMILDFVGQ